MVVRGGWSRAIVQDPRVVPPGRDTWRLVAAPGAWLRIVALGRNLWCLVALRGDSLRLVVPGFGSRLVVLRGG